MPCDDRAVGLAVDDQRIDAAPDVVDRGVARDLDRAGVGIDLDLADRAAVRKHRLVHLVVGHHRDAVLEVVGQRVARSLGGKFEEIEAAVGVARREAPVVELDLVRRLAEDDRGDALAFGDDLDGGLGEHGRGVAHRAAGMRAAADLHHVGVAEDDLHRFDRHVQEVGDDLREARLVALAARLRADHDVDTALRPHRDARLLVRARRSRIST